MKSRLAVAAVQLTSTEDSGANLSRAVEWVRQAAQAGADLVTLPENYAFLGDSEDRCKAAQAVDGPFTAPLREAAQEYRVCVLAGSIPERGPDPGHTYNTSVLIGRSGETVAVYRKIHLFDVSLSEAQFAESASVTAGHEVVTAEIDGWVLGLSICYDLRFPELYRRLSAAGARLLIIPSAFTLHTGKDHWELLVRARAVENLCYVVAPAQFGRHSPKRVSWGKSMVVDPWGTLLAVAPEREGFVMAALDAAEQDQVRETLPVLRHRRL